MLPVTEDGTRISWEFPVAEQITTTAGRPSDSEVAINPRTGRPDGCPQAVVLLLPSRLSLLGAVLLAPVLPAIQNAFGAPAGATAELVVGDRVVSAQGEDVLGFASSWFSPNESCIPRTAASSSARDLPSSVPRAQRVVALDDR